jgi:hypothetical protein
MNDTFLKPLSRTVPDNDWVIVIACLVAMVYITARILFPRYLTRLNHAFFNRYEATKLIEEKNVLFNRGGFLLNLIPLFSVAMIVLVQMSLFSPDFLLVHPLRNYLEILALTLLYFGGRVLLVSIFGYSFEQKEVALRFNQVWLIQFENLGTIILVPSMVLPFTVGIVQVVLIAILWAILSFWLVYTIIRELEILKSYRISIFYMFLYLCTLEILPLWWVIQSMTEGW